MASAISSSIIAGDGIGKPSGLLHPNSGIPILDTAPSTPEGTFTWQDLVSLKFDVPMQWHNGGAYYCNQRTLGLLCTMSDAIGRPLLQALPQGMPPFAIAGSPIIVVTQMPDCLPGNTPILYGNLQQAYTLVQRSGTMMTPDPYSGQYCTLYKFESRVGSAVTCGNAARLPSHQVSAMRDHYHGFSHPVLDLPPRAVTHLFAEFDQIASELRAHPKFVADDLQIAFCQLQKMRLPSLPRNEWLWLFGIWRDQDRAQQGIDGAKRDARYQELTDERELLFKVRERHPEQRRPDGAAREDRV